MRIMDACNTAQTGIREKAVYGVDIVVTDKLSTSQNGRGGHPIIFTQV